jgi:heat shock protein HslJ
MSRPSHLPRLLQSVPFAFSMSLILSVGLLASLPGNVAAQDAQPGQPDIEGYSWQLLEYRDSDGSLELVPPGIGATANLWFEVIQGDGACSSFRSTYKLLKETLIIDPPALTQRGCDAESQSIDDAFFRNLTEIAAWSRDGSILELRDPIGDVLMTFTEAQIPNDPTIAPWRLARIAASDGSIGPVVPGTDPSVQFLRGGRLVGTTGCGWFLGSYTTNDTIMDISDVQFRNGSCTSELLAQATNIVDTLDEISDFKLLPAGLTMQDRTGVTRMALEPSIPLGQRTWTPIAVLDEDGKSLVDPVRLRTSAVRFANNRADGRTVCRSYAASSLRSGLALTVFDVNGVKAPGCRKKTRGRQTVSKAGVERLFLERLERASSHALRGSELELMDASGTPIMRLLPQPALRGVSWALTAMDTAPKAPVERLKPPQGAEPITATFESIDVVQGQTGKNAYDGFYSTPRASIMEITEIKTDGNRCNGRKARLPLCVQEAAFIAILQSADGYVVASDGLSLLKGSRKLAEFEQAVEAPEAN